MNSLNGNGLHGPAKADISPFLAITVPSSIG